MRDALVRLGIAAVGAAIVLAALLYRAGGSPAREGRSGAPASFPVAGPSSAPAEAPAEEPPRSASLPPSTVELLPAEPAPADPASLEIRLDDKRAADVAELDLTGSQRTTIEVLLRREALVMEELRQDLERFGPDVWATVSARARETHAATLAAVRQGLLPEQAERFDRWVREGRWPGYVLPVPSRP